MHLPVDHHLRGFYRGLCLLAGALMAAFGVAAFVVTRDRGEEWFGQSGERVWGLTANPASALGILALGILVLGVALIGRQAQVWLNVALGGALMLVGLVALALLRTSANYLAFSIANVNVTFVLGTLLLTAGMYATVTRVARKG
jgi:hypothetical protein